jgi:hypothetical protein
MMATSHLELLQSAQLTPVSLTVPFAQALQPALNAKMDSSLPLEALQHAQEQVVKQIQLVPV